jgi:hypothetical protein
MRTRIISFIVFICFAFTSVAIADQYIKWSHVNYKVTAGRLTATQKRQLENALRRWCKCPVRQVKRGYNLSVSIKPPTNRNIEGMAWPYHRPAKIQVHPHPPEGFGFVVDHEVHHLVHPNFAP